MSQCIFCKMCIKLMHIGEDISVYPSVCMFELLNCCTDFDEIWFECYDAIGSHARVIFFNFLQYQHGRCTYLLGGSNTSIVRFEVSTAVTMMIIIWEMTRKRVFALANHGSLWSAPCNIPGNEPRPTLPGYSSPHCNIWYPSTRLVFPPTLAAWLWLPYPHNSLHTQYTVILQTHPSFL
jgi:hypothetical protein